MNKVVFDIDLQANDTIDGFKLGTLLLLQDVQLLHDKARSYCSHKVLGAER